MDLIYRRQSHDDHSVSAAASDGLGVIPPCGWCRQLLFDCFPGDRQGQERHYPASPHDSTVGIVHFTLDDAT